MIYLRYMNFVCIIEIFVRTAYIKHEEYVRMCIVCLILKNVYFTVLVRNMEVFLKIHTYMYNTKNAN